MNDTVWYYVDRAQQRHGPVTAAAIADAWRAGLADDSCLVWREGMPEWQPLGGFRDELGLGGEAPSPVAVAAATPAPRPYVAPSAVPTTPQKSGSGCLIAAVIGGIVLLVIVGILAAIAVPAYQDYVERAEAARAGAESASGSSDDDSSDGDWPSSGTSEGAGLVALALAEARQHQVLVDDFVANTDRCPRDGTEVAVPPVVSAGVVGITVGEARTGMCTIEIELGGPGLESLAGERLTLSRDVAGDWYCTSDIADRDTLPEECR